MRRLPLTLTAGLLFLGCGDDSPGDGTAAGSSGTAGPSDSTGTPASTTDAPGTTAADSTGADSTTGPATVCGNGEIEGEEECDDENMLDDDECYSNCTIPYEVLWTQTYDGGEDDFARDVIFADDGSVWVVGTNQVAGDDYDIWLQQYAADGTPGEGWTYAGAEGGTDIGRALAWHPSGDLILVGVETTTNAEDVLVARLSVDGGVSPVWMNTIDGPGSGTGSDDTDFANAVDVDADGNILVAATYRVDGELYDIFLGKYDGDGNELWTHVHDEEMMNETPDAVLADPGGDIYLVGNIQLMSGDIMGWVRKLDTDGVEIWTNTVPGVQFIGGALAPSGDIALVGFDLESATAPDLWAGMYDPDFTEIGVTNYTETGLADQGNAIAVGGSGDLYVGGAVTVPGQLYEAWAGRYMAGLGLRWWHHSSGHEESMLDDEVLGIAVNDDESRVVMVGTESVVGQNGNIWVRMLDNRPPPLL